MFDHSSYSKTFMKYVKLYVYIKIYLSMNQMIEKKINNYLNFLIRQTVIYILKSQRRQI